MDTEPNYVTFSVRSSQCRLRVNRAKSSSNRLVKKQFQTLAMPTDIHCTVIGFGASHYCAVHVDPHARCMFRNRPLPYHVFGLFRGLNFQTQFMRIECTCLSSTYSNCM